MNERYKEDNPATTPKEALPIHTTNMPAETFGDIEMDFLQHRVSIGEHSLELTPKEFLLLYALVRQAGEVVRRAELCAASGTSAEDWSLASHIYRLRKKLEGTGYGITLARARGYRLEKE